MPSDFIPPNPVQRALRKAIGTALKRSSRKASKLEAEITEADGAEGFKECGEIIKANLSQVQRGMDSVVLADCFAPGQERLIALDPFLKPMDNARAYFKKYKKCVKGKDRVEHELRLCREETGELDVLQKEFDEWEKTADEGADLPLALVEQAAHLRIHVQGLSSSGPVKDVSGNEPQAQSGVRAFESHDGLEILVGKGAGDNDRLTCKFAKGNDWWFHVASYSGSHVVVRGHVPRDQVGGSEKMADKKRKKDQQALPQETLLDAAHLAAYFSKARHATKPEVHYTQVKHVHKPRKAPPGQVRLEHHKTVLVKMEEKRLDRLLARHK